VRRWDQRPQGRDDRELGRAFRVPARGKQSLGIVDAFAAPGGYIVVFRGLLEKTPTPEEFAGVLAHEMQHVLLKHSARAIAREFSGRFR